MASSLGNAFGVAMSSTIYGFGASFMNLQLGGRRIIQCRNCFNCIYSNFNFSS